VTSEESTPVEPHDAYAAFRIPSFRHYLTGNFVFLVGLQMQKVALGWEIYERTGSALHLGYVGLAQFAPQLVLAPFGGHVVDAYNRKKVLFGALSVSLLCSFGLAQDSLTPAPLWVFYALLVVIGSARSFWMPARSAILPRIVPAPLFRNAVSWNSSLFELASIGGPALGGLAYLVFGSAKPRQYEMVSEGVLYRAAVSNVDEFTVIDAKVAPKVLVTCLHDKQERVEPWSVITEYAFRNQVRVIHLTISPDGTRVVAWSSGPERRSDLMLLDIKQRQVAPILSSPSIERNAEISRLRGS
jgi:hypothetical protein